MRVIGAGFGRTGTASLKRALEQLGFAPCHHMEELFRHPEEVATWERAGRGERIDWVSFLAPWQAAVDFPAAFYWRELMEAFPDAKVILTVREPNSWYDSFSSTIRPMIVQFPARQIVPWLPKFNVPWRVTRHPTMVKIAESERAEAVRAFEEHVAEVKRSVPPERLLVYEVKQGWEPLCRFLGVPVPQEPFPRVNEARDFQRRTKLVLALSWIFLLSPIFFVLLVLFLVQSLG